MTHPLREIAPGRIRLPGNVKHRRLIEAYGFDPFLTIPPGGEFFDLFSTQTIASSGGTEIFAQLRISPNEFIRISAIGMEADSNSVVAISSMFFRLRVNLKPHQFYGNMADQIGTGQRPTEVTARIFQSGALLDFMAENNHASVSALSFGRIQGWTIPLV